MVSGHSIATLILFIFSIIFVIQPLSLPIPLPYIGRKSFPINLTTAPIIAILVLWAAKCLGPHEIRDGIVGTDGVKPYNIIILFFSLAYMSITLDVTGVLESAALWVSTKGGSNGWKLFLYFYLMLTALSVFIGNDPVILSGTIFLVYYTKANKLKAIPWLISEFAAANTASMVLFVGNPTNVVICEGFQVNNVGFTAYTILPFLACSISCFIALAIQFRSHEYLPRELTYSEKKNAKDALLDPLGACVGSALLGACLVVIIVVSFFKIDVWMISLPFALAKFLWDLGWDRHRYNRLVVEDREKSRDTGLEEKEPYLPKQLKPQGTVSTIKSDDLLLISTPNGNANGAANKHVAFDEPIAEEPIPQLEPILRPESFSTFSKEARSSFPSVTTHTRVSSRSNTSKTLLAPTPSSNLPLADSSAPSKDKTFSFSSSNRLDRLSEYMSTRFTTLHKALPRLPFALVPFAFSQFILIEALSRQGWIEIFAHWLVVLTGRETFKTIWVVGVLGVLLCNASGTNIGATILLTKIMRAAASSYVPPLSGPVINIQAFLRSAAIALAVASNIGAVSFTFSASLAGLLWKQILNDKKEPVTQWEFAKWNLRPVTVMTAVGLAVVSAEMAVLY